MHGQLYKKWEKHGQLSKLILAKTVFQSSTCANIKDLQTVLNVPILSAVFLCLVNLCHHVVLGCRSNYKTINNYCII